MRIFHTGHSLTKPKLVTCQLTCLRSPPTGILSRNLTGRHVNETFSTVTNAVKVRTEEKRLPEISGNIRNGF